MATSDVAATPTPGADDSATVLTDPRPTLVALHQEGKRYRFLDLAYRYLAAVDHDPTIALAVLRSLVELGLGGPARELLAHRRDLSDSGLDVEELGRTLAPVPIGRLPWEKLTDQFERNLAALLASRPHIGPGTALFRRALSA